MENSLNSGVKFAQFGFVMQDQYREWKVQTLYYF